jgi:sterol desaturase/sphingolipid hydroxylase (fatty acid hydroxylase superfamily)
MSDRNLNDTSALFYSSLINSLTRTNVYIYYCFYVLLIIAFLIKCLFMYSLPIFLINLTIGFMIWLFFEYIIHRFIFHWKSKTIIQRIVIYILHEVHHTYPRDVSRSISPLFISIPLSVLFYFIFKLIFINQALSIYSGFLLGYVIYTIIHDSTHHFPMNFIIIKNLKRNHMRHHYFDNKKNFGVTCPLWDYIFNTKF